MLLGIHYYKTDVDISQAAAKAKAAAGAKEKAEAEDKATSEKAAAEAKVVIIASARHLLYVIARVQCVSRKCKLPLSWF